MNVRALALAIVTLAVAATLALAEPRMDVGYADGVPRLTLTGEYAGAWYAVYRAPAPDGAFEPITQGHLLCLGACSTLDHSAVPGDSYRYRFDLLVRDGDADRLVSYGPFLATISPALAGSIGVYAFPSPGRGPTTVQLHVAGTASDAEASIFDLAGRRQQVIHRGALARGLTTLTWDGRDAHGALLPSGVYLLRFTAGGQRAMMRLVRR